MKYGLITLLICWILYEIGEHLIFPLFWMIRYGKRKSAYGPSGMIGRYCTVKQWHGTSGKVEIGGELWNAHCRSPLQAGDEAVIKGIEGLALRVAPSGEPDSGH